MSFTLRPLVAADAARVAALIRRDHHEPASVEEVRERIAGAEQAGRMVLRLGVESEAGALIGYGHAIRDGYMEPGLFWAQVVVDPIARRHGAGAYLHDAVRSFACGHGGTWLRGEIRDHLPEGMPFAKAMGYTVERHIFESTLQVASFDERPFLSTLEAVRAAGIRFFSLAEVGDTREARERLGGLSALSRSIFPAARSRLSAHSRSGSARWRSRATIWRRGSLSRRAVTSGSPWRRCSIIPRAG
jgi:GNAT superfamily N-acetyltransferase